MTLGSLNVFPNTASSSTNINNLSGYPLTVNHGGTGSTSLSPGGVLIGHGTSPVTSIAMGAGTVLIGTAVGTDPVAQTLTGGAGITITSVSGSITISAAGGGTAWLDMAGSFTAHVNTGYFITATSTAILFAAPLEGDTVIFVYDSIAGNLTIQANAGQSIRFGAALSSIGGTAVNVLQGDSVTLVYRAANATWQATSIIGNWTVS